MEKVILISIDGMRPDGLLNCKNPYLDTLLKESTYTLDAKTVLPSVTLPCHMSMFYSVTPERHGITTNLYTPPVRPIDGLFEQLGKANKMSAMYYGWGPIRDVARPELLKASEYIWAYSFDNTDKMLTESACRYIEKAEPDFVFLYMVETDEKGGHDNGWMSEAYLECINKAIDNVKTVVEKFGDKYTVIVTADHGGHDRAHGSDMAEDVTIPIMFRGNKFEKGKNISGVSILDLTPTIADVMEINASEEWEGKSILK